MHAFFLEAAHDCIVGIIRSMQRESIDIKAEESTERWTFHDLFRELWVRHVHVNARL